MIIKRAIKLLRFSIHRISEEKLSQVAASLTFTTVLSLVPLLAVFLALFTAFPAFTEFKAALDNFLLNSLFPPAVSATVMDYINKFVANATEFKAIGGLFLGFAALSVVMTVDQVLNDIWRVRKVRSWPQRIMVYWAVLSLGPIVFGASLWFTSSLARESSGWLSHAPLLASVLVSVISLSSTMFAFTAIFIVVPNCYVSWKDALIGGSVVAIILECFRAGFSFYINSNASYTSLYGAFAVIPIFLLWLYLSWTVILFGAVLTASLPQIRMGRWEVKRESGAAFIDAMMILKELVQCRGHVPAGIETQTFSMRLKVNIDEVLEVLEILSFLGYVARLNDGAKERWALVCDPTQTKFKPLVDKLLLDGRYLSIEEESKLHHAIVTLWAHNDEMTLLDAVSNG